MNTRRYMGYFIYHSTDTDMDYTNAIMRAVDEKMTYNKFIIGRIVNKKDFISDWYIGELYNYPQILKDAYETN
jgi:hypothetical protein